MVSEKRGPGMMLSGSNQAFILIYQLAIMVESSTSLMVVEYLSDCGCKDLEKRRPRNLHPKLLSSHRSLSLKVPKK